MKIRHINKSKQTRDEMIKKIDNKNKTMQDAYLIGPFIGNLAWEIYRFSPYIIYLKKQNPNKKFIIFTRSSRFDLYGVYADILLPLSIESDSYEIQDGFTIRNFSVNEYNKITEYFFNRYKKDYKIIEHIYPRISNFNYNVKWQYSRNLMDYSFKPRSNNFLFIDSYLKSYKKKKTIIINSDSELKISNRYNKIYLNNFFKDINENDNSISKIGCLIELIKQCECVVSKFNNVTSQLSLLLNKRVVLLDDYIDETMLSINNPMNTKVSYFREGVK